MSKKMIISKRYDEGHGVIKTVALRSITVTPAFDGISAKTGQAIRSKFVELAECLEPGPGLVIDILDA